MTKGPAISGESEELLERFLNLSIRKNCPLKAVEKNPLELKAVLSALKSFEGSDDNPLASAKSFLEGPGDWLRSDPEELVHALRTYKKELEEHAFAGKDLSGLVRERREAEREKFKKRSHALQREHSMRILKNDNADAHFMKEALAEAQKAKAHGEVPIGAVVVLDGKIIGRGCNQVVSQKDPTAHAEILAIREACRTADNYRLIGADLYVNLEPCPMCAGAILNARIRRVVYGTEADEKNKCCGSSQVLKTRKPNEIPYIFRGVLEEECREILKDFFSEKRGGKGFECEKS